MEEVWTKDHASEQTSVGIACDVETTCDYKKKNNFLFHGKNTLIWQYPALKTSKLQRHIHPYPYNWELDFWPNSVLEFAAQISPVSM